MATAAAAWVSLDAADNDPGRLWTHVATALERAGCALAPDVAGFMAANSGDLIAGMLPRLVKAMASMDEDVVLILDDFHYLQSAACREQVEFLIENLPEQAHLVIVSRADPGLRLGRLRASGLLAEIRAEQLSFTAEEAAALLGTEQVQLSAPALAQLMGRTEGWPAGVYLAGLSLSGRPDADELVRGSGGNDRFVTSYFSEEVLSLDSERVRDFILTTSILDRFCAPLCDAVGRHDRLGTRSSTTWSARTCSWSRWTAMVAGSGSTTCSPRSPAASWRPGTPTGCRSCTSALPSGTARTVTSTRRSRTCAPPVSAARLPG